MYVARLRLAALIAGVLAAGSASALSIKVQTSLYGYQDTFAPASGQVDPTAASSTTYTDDTFGTSSAIACVSGSTANCTKYAPAGSTIVLNFTGGGTNTTFAGWSGCNSVNGTECTVLLTSSRVVTANFKPTTYEVRAKTYPIPTASWDPPYGGTMAGAGIANYQTGIGGAYAVGAAANGINTVFSATPEAGSRVKSWSGCTPAAGADPRTCTLKAYGPTTVSVTFEANPTGPQLVSAQVAGSGTLTSGTPGAADYMACTATGGDCSAFVTYNSGLVLNALVPVGGKFAGFTGCSSVLDTACTLSNVTTSKAVTATFKAGSCDACHALPPATHTVFGASKVQCGACHPGYTSGTVNAAIHANGTVDTTQNAGGVAADPAGDGFNVTILDATLVASTQPVIRARFQDDAGNPICMTNATGCYYDPAAPQNRIGWAVGAPTAYSAQRVHVSKLATNGTFEPMLIATNVTAPATASTSESLPDSGVASGNPVFTAVAGQPGVYDITLANYISAAEKTSTAYNARGQFDPAATYRVAFVMYRYGGAAKNVVYASNPYLDITPSGTLLNRNYLASGACAACHGNFKLDFHGNIRMGQEGCKHCHLDGYGQSGAVAALSDGSPIKHKADRSYQNFAHRLHSGKSLYAATSPYAKSTSWDFDHVKMAPSHKLYFEGGSVAIPPSSGSASPVLDVIDPELTIDCTVCHGSQDVWYTKPSRKACGSCHDAVDFDTGAGHGSGIPMAGDTCSGCHPASGPIIYSSGVPVVIPIQATHGKFYEPAHKVSFLNAPSWPAGGYNFQVSLVDAEVSTTGVPTFTVDVSLNGAPFDIKASIAATTANSNTVDAEGGRVATCAFMVAGPTSDYVIPATGGTAVSCGGTTRAGNWTFVSSTATSSRFTYRDPAASFFADKAAGKYTISFEIMWQRVVRAGVMNPGLTTTANDYIRKPFSANPNFLTVDWTGSAGTMVTGEALLAAQRRAVVDFAKCNGCHQDIGFHSNRGRKGPDYCATCHNPKLDNGGRARYTVAEAELATAWDPSLTATTVYLPESVSMNMFIHRIHMGSKLPSVSGTELVRVSHALTGGDANNRGIPAVGAPAVASKWVQVPGVISYGATRASTVGLTADTGPSISDFSHFAMPNPMGRCDQCHISDGANDTWALNEGTGLAPIERTFRVCTPTTPSWASEPWCNVTSTSGPSFLQKNGQNVTVVTPPLKAVCTSCHDSAATDAHADLFTVGPMTRNATETCADCHGAGKVLDSLDVHQNIP